MLNRNLPNLNISNSGKIAYLCTAFLNKFILYCFSIKGFITQKIQKSKSS
jgi:hypothetical protein